MGAGGTARLAALDALQAVGDPPLTSGYRGRSLASEVIAQRMEEAADEDQDPSQVVAIELSQLREQSPVGGHGPLSLR